MRNKINMLIRYGLLFVGICVLISQPVYTQTEGGIGRIIEENSTLILSYDSNSDGEISSSELGEATEDFGQGEIESTELNYIEAVSNYEGDYRNYLEDETEQSDSEESNNEGLDAELTVNNNNLDGKVEVGEAITFDSSGSTAPDGEIADYVWDTDGDGIGEVTGQSSVTKSFEQTGEKTVSVVVHDDLPRNEVNTDTASKTVDVEPATENRCQITVEGKLVDSGEPASGVIKFDADSAGSSTIDKEKDVNGDYSVQFRDMPCDREFQNIQVWRDGELWGQWDEANWDMEKGESKTFNVNRINGAADFSLNSVDPETRKISDYNGQLNGNIIVKNDGGTENSAGAVRPVIYKGDREIAKGEEISLVDFKALDTIEVPLEIDQRELRSAAKSLGDSECEDTTSTAELRIEILTRRYFGEENSKELHDAGEIRFDNMITPQGPKAKIVSKEFRGSFPGEKTVTVKLRNNRCEEITVTPVFEILNEDKDSQTVNIPEGGTREVTLSGRESGNPQMVLKYEDSGFSEIIRDNSGEEKNGQSDEDTEGETLTYYIQFDVSELDTGGRIEMAGGNSRADGDESTVGRSGVLEVGKQYQAKYVSDEETISSKEINIPPPEELEYRGEVDQPILEVEFESGSNDRNNQENINTGKINLTLSPEELNIGESLNIETELPRDQVSEGQKIIIEDPEGEQIWENQVEEREGIYQIEINEEYTSGEYRVELKPQGNLINSILGAITGTETLATETFRVGTDQPEWVNYCRTNDYNTETIQEKVNCIEEEIIPEYFEGSTGSNPGVAESLCQDLLGYSYSKEENSCIS